MKDGFVRVACVAVDIKVADTKYNTSNMIKAAHEAQANGAKLIVFPELSVTAYTCSDLFLQQTLLDSAKTELLHLAKETADLDMAIVAGLPVEMNGSLYNCAAVINRGKIKGLVPKMNVPNYGEFYEARHFREGFNDIGTVVIGGCKVPIGGRLLFRADSMPEFVLGIEICEDLWTPNPPSCAHALAGATLIANLSASDELTAKDEYRSLLVRSQSAKLYCGYIYSDAGCGESTTDMVFAGDNIIAENGVILSRSKKFTNQCVYAELDLERMLIERRKATTYKSAGAEAYTFIDLELGFSDTELSRRIDPAPFVPNDESKRAERSEEILAIQSMGLRKRLEHTNA